MFEEFMENLQESDQPVSERDLVSALNSDVTTITRIAHDLHKQGKIRMVFNDHQWHYYPSDRPVWYKTEIDKMVNNLLKERESISHFEASSILNIRDIDALRSLMRLCDQCRATLDISKGVDFFKYTGDE